MGDDITVCPECGCKEVIFDHERGEFVCTGCGLVLYEHVVDRGPEWRAFTREEKERRARTGAPLTLTIHDKGLSTLIDWRNKDASGKDLSLSERIHAYKLRKWHMRVRMHTSADRNLVQAMNELERLASLMDLPQTVKESAALLYRIALESGMIRGRSISAMVAAVLYAACRIHGIPRKLDEVARESRISKKELGKYYRLLYGILKKTPYAIPFSDPLNFVKRFGSELNVSGLTIQKAIDILKKAKEKGLTAGKDPTGLAAAALYLAAIVTGERRTQREVAEVARVTEVTIRNRYKELVSALGFESLVSEGREFR